MLPEVRPSRLAESPRVAEKEGYGGLDLSPESIRRVVSTVVQRDQTIDVADHRLLLV